MLPSDRASASDRRDFPCDPCFDVGMKAQEIKCPGQRQRGGFVSRHHERQNIVTNDGLVQKTGRPMTGSLARVAPCAYRDKASKRAQRLRQLVQELRTKVCLR